MRRSAGLARNTTKLAGAALGLLALAAGTPPAQAVYVNPDGIGQVLLFPYYTVQSGQSTLLTLSNGSARGKIVQLNFREGYNGRLALSIDVVLAPKDTWTANVFAPSEDGGAAVTTSDTGCTIPALPTVSSGASARLQASFTDVDFSGLNADGGSAQLSRTREGYIEVVERAELDGALAEAVVGGRCQAFQPLPPEADSPDILPPAGALRGSFAIVDVPQGTLLGGNATALEGFATKPLYLNNNTRLENVDTLALPDNGTAEVVAQIDLGGRLLNIPFPAARKLEALSAVLMTDALRSDYSSETGLGSSTAWVLSAPTKRFHTDLQRHRNGLAPYLRFFNESEDRASCVRFDALLLDRDGLPQNLTAETGQPPPRQRPAHALCYATDVVAIGSSTQTPVGSSQLLTRVEATNALAQNGVLHLQLGFNSIRTARTNLELIADQLALVGLPVITLQAQKYINGNVTPGMLANYTLARPLVSTVSCRGPHEEAVPCP